MSLFIPRHAIETAQEMQYEIAMMHPDFAPQKGQEAIDVIGNVSTIYDEKKVLVHSYGSYIINRGLTIDEQILESRFNESWIIGDVACVNYVQSAKLGLQTLTLELIDSRMLYHSGQRVEADEVIPPLVTIPVLDIKTVLPAAV